MLYDVAVIGGGPSGTTVATLLRQQGWRVILFEMRRYPRFHIGESLNPQSLFIFDRLGVTSKLQEGGFVLKLGAIAEIADNECYLHFRNGKTFNPRPFSYQVERAKFDQILLENARGHGVEVVEPSRVTDVSFGPEAQTISFVREGQGQEQCQARLVADASGRSRYLARRFKLHLPDTKIKTQSIFAHYRGVQGDDPPYEGYFRAVLFKNGWFWFIPLAGGIMSVGVVVNGDDSISSEGSLEERFNAMIAAFPPVARRMKDAVRLTPVYRQREMAYDSTRYSGDGFILVGDAAFFLDPVFSTGVYAGMRGAEIAAQAADESLRQHDVSANAFRNYDRRVAEYHTVIARVVYCFYNGLRHDGMIRFIVNVVRRTGGNDLIMRRLQDFSNGRYLERKTFMAVFCATVNMSATLADLVRAAGSRVWQTSPPAPQ
jgi:flavin-dependent dehydrogenase